METIVHLATRHHGVSHVLADVASGYLAEQQEAVFLVVPFHSELPHQLKDESAKNEFKIELKEPSEYQTSPGFCLPRI